MINDYSEALSVTTVELKFTCFKRKLFYIRLKCDRNRINLLNGIRSSNTDLGALESLPHPNENFEI
jgi:hypothetical protein